MIHHQLGVLAESRLTSYVYVSLYVTQDPDRLDRVGGVDESGTGGSSVNHSEDGNDSSRKAEDNDAAGERSNNISQAREYDGEGVSTKKVW